MHMNFVKVILTFRFINHAYYKANCNNPVHHEGHYDISRSDNDHNSRKKYKFMFTKWQIEKILVFHVNQEAHFLSRK